MLHYEDIKLNCKEAVKKGLKKGYLTLSQYFTLSLCLNPFATEISERSSSCVAIT